MIPICDYHLHTPLCGHAKGEPKEYAEQAIIVGLKEIGFSDHAPMVKGETPGITMSMDQLPEYYRMIEEVQARYQDDLKIKIGIEADFLPGYEEKTNSLIQDYPYDYVIGSVHYINDWGFDDPNEKSRWEKADVNQVYRQYYQLLRQSAKSQMFDIIGHCDLPKKFGYRPSIDLTDEVRKTAHIFKESGIVIEINTAGLRKPVNEMYPSLSALKIYCELDIPLTFGSDAHVPVAVGSDFTEAINLARTAGYTEYVTFSKRKIEQRIKI